MCGLAGILLRPKRRAPEALAEIRALTTANLVSNEERGRAASGITIVQTDGSYHTLKQPTPASALVKTTEYRAMLAAIDQDTVCILGHTRRPTKGSPYDNDNNHPIIAEHIIGVHNGHIDNDDDLFATHRLPREGDVDSEVIFRLLSTLSPPEPYAPFVPRIRTILAEIEGTYITLSLDLRRPTQLLILKQMHPLSLHYHRGLEALILSSRYVFLRNTFGQIVTQETLDSGFGYCFDAERLAQMKGCPDLKFELTRS